ncbi:hypothetical protein ACVOUJ_003480 [Vibrio vulnificus]|uniref:hypothetical protein n=1 Tax=Vibrio vulnificus TaxID=672 RepID=UPI0013EECFE1|nr:hypothetical protein [Vibrio vulnificus]
MDSRVHGNDDGCRGGGALSLYGIVVLLVFSVIICSSNFFLITSVCQPLSVSPLVILAKAGNHRTASVVGFALCSCWLWQVRFQTWHLACVDEWISVRTGMTAGGVAAVKYYIGGNNGW